MKGGIIGKKIFIEVDFADVFPVRCLGGATCDDCDNFSEHCSTCLDVISNWEESPE